MNNEQINVLTFAAASGMGQRDLYVLEKQYGRKQVKTVVEWTKILQKDFVIPKVIS